MCLRLFFTASRGRSAVPVTLLRIRSRIRPRAWILSFARSIFVPRCPFFVVRASKNEERTTNNLLLRAATRARLGHLTFVNPHFHADRSVGRIGNRLAV